MEALRHWTGRALGRPPSPVAAYDNAIGGDGDQSPGGAWRISRLGNGLINDTWHVETDFEPFVLQRVNPVFSPEIHHNIRAVTGRLRAAGMFTPELLDTDHGSPWVVDDEGAVWRLMTYVPGRSFDAVQSLAQATSAGALVARVHEALDELEHEFVGLRTGVHDTQLHMRSLERAVAEHRGHRLYDRVAPVADAILRSFDDLEPLPDIPDTICHGDLKFNNLRFSSDGEQALCLVDLDTFAPMSLAFELGDAWRSWCNPGGETESGVGFDLEVFAAAYRGYVSGRRRALGDDERRALVIGVEWISLELAARFCADALAERYFGWNHAEHASRGDHNLVRARGQLRLHEVVKDGRAARQRVVDDQER